MLTVNETLLAVVRNIEQWDFEITPKFSLNENEAKIVADALQIYMAQKMLNEFQTERAKK